MIEKYENIVKKKSYKTKQNTPKFKANLVKQFIVKPPAVCYEKAKRKILTDDLSDNTIDF